MADRHSRRNLNNMHQQEPMIANVEFLVGPHSPSGGHEMHADSLYAQSNEEIVRSAREPQFGP